MNGNQRLQNVVAPKRRARSDCAALRVEKRQRCLQALVNRSVDRQSLSALMV